jgi:DNA-directed RNA polymerase specialized sigma24 family protein
MLREPEDAADAVEDTFIITVGRLDRLRDPRKLRPWLYAVARNECHSRVRPSHSAVPSPPDFPTPAFTPQPRPTDTSTASSTATSTATSTASPTFTFPATPPT